MASKDEIQRQLEERMRDFQSQIEELNRKLEESGKETRKELENSLDDLQERNQRIERQLKDLRDAGDDVWQTVAEDIETYWKAFSGAVNNVFIKSDKSDRESTSPSTASTTTYPTDESSSDME